MDDPMPTLLDEGEQTDEKLEQLLSTYANPQVRTALEYFGKRFAFSYDHSRRLLRWIYRQWLAQDAECEERARPSS